MSELEGEIAMSAATAPTPAPGSALAALRKDQGAGVAVAVTEISSCTIAAMPPDAMLNYRFPSSQL